MLDVNVTGSGEVALSGRFDAAQVENAKKVFDGINESCVVNFQELEYISSAGLSVLLVTQKRLNESGNSIKLTNLNKYISAVFRYAGFDTIFEIE